MTKKNWQNDETKLLSNTHYKTVECKKEHDINKSDIHTNQKHNDHTSNKSIIKHHQPNVLVAKSSHVIIIIIHVFNLSDFSKHYSKTDG